MTSAPRILFFADAGAQVGGGHVMRCLTLARALVDRGAECAFVESRSAIQFLRRFGWPSQTLLAVAQTDDLAGLVAYAREFAGLFEPDVVVVDHYQAGVEDEFLLRRIGCKVVVLDDLADRQHDADLLVDPGYGRKAEAYRGLVPEAAHILAGPDHALVRPEFAAARHRAMSRRARHGPVRRVLVSLGLTDIGGMTARVARTLLPLIGEARLDVVIGSGAPSLEELTRLAQGDRRLHLAIDAADMATLTAEADLAIGAGGSSVWERCVVGLPSVTLVLAENQRAMAQRMADAGLTLALDALAEDFEARLADAWATLSEDAAMRWRLAERSAEHCDGQGAARVAEAILRLQLFQ